jgi:hypothetical protein
MGYTEARSVPLFLPHDCVGVVDTARFWVNAELDSRLTGAAKLQRNAVHTFEDTLPKLPRKRGGARSLNTSWRIIRGELDNLAVCDA